MQWRVTCKRDDGETGVLRTSSLVKAVAQLVLWLLKGRQISIERVE